MPIASIFSKRPVIIAAVCIVAVLFRLPSLLNDGLWRDEANVFVDVSAPTIHDFISRVISIEYHPPLYFLLVYAWTRAFGATEFTLQFLPFIFSIATVPLIVWLGTIAESPLVGFLAALLFAIARVPVTNSTEYVYPLMGFLCTLIACLVLRARRQPLTFAMWWSIAIVTAMAAYTHYIALLFVPFVIVWSLSSPRGIRHGIGISSALAFGLATFVGWLPVFLHQRTVGRPYAAEISISEKVAQFIGCFATCMPAYTALFASLFFSLAVVGVIVVAVTRSLKADPAALGGLFVGTLAVASAANLSTVRYVSPFCGLLYVCLAAVAVRVCIILQSAFPYWRGWGPQAAVSVVAALTVLNAVEAIRTSAVPKSGIRSLAAANAIERPALYVIAPDYLAPTFAFYARHRPPAFIGFVRMEHPEIFTLEGYANDWSDKGVVVRSLATISQTALSFKVFHVIVDRFSSDLALVPYSKVWLLIEGLKARFKLVGETSYLGRYESITDFRFATSAASRSFRAGR